MGPWGLAVPFPPELHDRCVTGLCVPVASQSVLHFKTVHCLCEDVAVSTEEFASDSGARFHLCILTSHVLKIIKHTMQICIYYQIKLARKLSNMD